jgi:hypothetical protein
MIIIVCDDLRTDVNHVLAHGREVSQTIELTLVTEQVKYDQSPEPVLDFETNCSLSHSSFCIAEYVS